jgi:hypothetical protein
MGVNLGLREEHKKLRLFENIVEENVGRNRRM